MDIQKFWYVYIVRCSDGTLYTGITPDIDRRIKLHNSGYGAKYTKGRRPVSLVYAERMSCKGEAGKREYEIKHKTRIDKEKLVSYTQCDYVAN